MGLGRAISVDMTGLESYEVDAIQIPRSQGLNILNPIAAKDAGVAPVGEQLHTLAARGDVEGIKSLISKNGHNTHTPKP